MPTNEIWIKVEISTRLGKFIALDTMEQLEPDSSFAKEWDFLELERIWTIDLVSWIGESNQQVFRSWDSPIMPQIAFSERDFALKIVASRTLLHPPLSLAPFGSGKCNCSPAFRFGRLPLSFCSPRILGRASCHHQPPLGAFSCERIVLNASKCSNWSPMNRILGPLLNSL